MSGATVHDPTPCDLGEGPLWHPERDQLFWVDILGQRLLTREGGETRHWDFGEHVSALGWIDADTLLVASETALLRFDLATGARDLVAPLEADRPDTRSNDGRADPWGGFWIGTMGKAAERGAGAIYRYHRGELRRLHDRVTIPNAICFTADRRFAHFADTARRRVFRQPLGDRDGWPAGEAETFLDLRAEGLNPDGAVIDSRGTFWCAQWGAARVAAYDASGRFLRAIPFPARHTSCPAFGGPDLATLYCTSARQGLSPETLQAEPANGMTFAHPADAPGLPEPRVIL